jgi:hypothetical protein
MTRVSTCIMKSFMFIFMTATLYPCISWLILIKSLKKIVATTEIWIPDLSHCKRACNPSATVMLYLVAWIKPCFNLWFVILITFYVNLLLTLMLMFWRKSSRPYIFHYSTVRFVCVLRLSTALKIASCLRGLNYRVEIDYRSSTAQNSSLSFQKV